VANRERLLLLRSTDLEAGLSQTTELARVKARIKALAEKTVANGCTEAEALSAAEMVGRLLEQYALSMDEIDVRTSRCVQAEVPLGGHRRRATARFGWPAPPSPILTMSALNGLHQSAATSSSGLRRTPRLPLIYSR
jgi:hypothetical protein